MDRITTYQIPLLTCPIYTSSPEEALWGRKLPGAKGKGKSLNSRILESFESVAVGSLNISGPDIFSASSKKQAPLESLNRASSIPQTDKGQRISPYI